jgi:DNA-binding HxlR family transcriptional regulator
MLSERLKELESEGVVTRTVIPDTPVRIEYHLTEKGRALAGVVDAVAAWAGEWVSAVDAAGDDDQAPARGSAVEPTGRRG